MITDIFHDQQFRVRFDDFEWAIKHYTFVESAVSVGDMISATYRDTLGNAHTYVFPLRSDAYDVWASTRQAIKGSPAQAQPEVTEQTTPQENTVMNTQKIAYNFAFELGEEFFYDANDHLPDDDTLTEMKETVNARIQDQVNAELAEAYPVAKIEFVWDGYPYKGWQWTDAEDREIVNTLPDAYVYDLDNDINEVINRITADPAPLFEGLH